MNKTICITGASTGLGLDATAYMIDKGFDVIATVRKKEDGVKLQNDFGDRVFVVYMDLVDPKSINNAVKTISDHLGERGLYALINNAGVAVPGPLMYLPMEKFKFQFEVNVFGLLEFTQGLFPKLRTEAGSRVINISSVSGLVTSPFTGAYSASKFALEALSDGMRRELMLFDIKVVIIEPGPVKTPIWRKNMNVADDYKDTPYKDLLKHAEDVIANTEANAIRPVEVSRAIYRALTLKNPRTRYIVHKKKWLFWLISRAMPDKWLDKLLVKRKFEGDAKHRPF